MPMFYRLLLCLTLMVFVSVAAKAQTLNKRRTDGIPNASKRTGADQIGSPEEEMLGRSAIKQQENEHKENLERAKESAQLGSELRTAFERSSSLSREDIKKLERMEKLARKIRSRVGGSDDDVTLENPPRELKAALTRLAELSEELHKSVEKTSRHVVSTAVIERSNELIELIRYIRDFAH